MGKASFWVAIGLFLLGALMWIARFVLFAADVARSTEVAYDSVLAVEMVAVAPLGHLLGFVFGIIGVARPQVDRIEDFARWAASNR